MERIVRKRGNSRFRPSPPNRRIFQGGGAVGPWEIQRFPGGASRGREERKGSGGGAGIRKLFAVGPPVALRQPGGELERGPREGSSGVLFTKTPTRYLPVSAKIVNASDISKLFGRTIEMCRSSVKRTALWLFVAVTVFRACRSEVRWTEGRIAHPAETDASSDEEGKGVPTVSNGHSTEVPSLADGESA